MDELCHSFTPHDPFSTAAWQTSTSSHIDTILPSSSQFRQLYLFPYNSCFSLDRLTEYNLTQTPRHLVSIRSTTKWVGVNRIMKRLFVVRSTGGPRCPLSYCSPVNRLACTGCTDWTEIKLPQCSLLWSCRLLLALTLSADPPKARSIFYKL